MSGLIVWCITLSDYAIANPTYAYALRVIATAVILFALSSGAALATVVDVLIEVPLMLMLVSLCKRTQHLFYIDTLSKN